MNIFSISVSLSAIEKENERLKARAHALKIRSVDLRIDNMNLTNEKHFFEQEKVRTNDLVKQTEIKNQKLLEREETLIVEQRENRKLTNKVKRFVKEIMESPSDFKDRIILKLKKEREKLMSLLDEKLNQSIDLEKELENQLEQNIRQNEELAEKFKQLEYEREEQKKTFP